MALNVTHWNGRFLDHWRMNSEALNMAESYGIVVNAAEVDPKEEYWACIGVRHLTGRENMGNHNIFCDVLDSVGNRVNRAEIIMWQGNQAPVTAVVDKPPWEAGTNLPIWGETPSDVAVLDRRKVKSDKVEGFRINHPDEGEGNTIGHHSFYVVWMLVEAPDEPAKHKPRPKPKPKPDEEPNPGDIVGTEHLTFEVDEGRHQIDLVVVIRKIGG